MTDFFPYFDTKFKNIRENNHFLPDADLNELRTDILNLA
jgi:hypothetical protein